MLLLSSADFLQNELFQKEFRNTISVSNSLDPDQDRHSVGPDLGLNCYQRLSLDLLLSLFLLLQVSLTLG